MVWSYVDLRIECNIHDPFCLQGLQPYWIEVKGQTTPSKLSLSSDRSFAKERFLKVWSPCSSPVQSRSPCHLPFYWEGNPLRFSQAPRFWRENACTSKGKSLTGRGLVATKQGVLWRHCCHDRCVILARKWPLFAWSWLAFSVHVIVHCSGQGGRINMKFTEVILEVYTLPTVPKLTR